MKRKQPRFTIKFVGDTNPVRVAALALAEIAPEGTVDQKAFARVAKIVGNKPKARGFVVQDRMDALDKLCRIGGFSIRLTKRGKLVPVLPVKRGKERAR